VAQVVQFERAADKRDDTVTELAVARQFSDEFVDRFAYCHSRGCWYFFNGSIWRRQEKPSAFHAIRSLVERMSADATRRSKIQTATFCRGVEAFVRADAVISRTADEWDSDPFLLGTPDGTVDLRTGVLRRPDPAEGITKATSVAPAATADCPLWRRFVSEATGGDTGLALFLQRWGGYCLTGDTREHALVFIHGDGGNGKSVFQNTISAILGEYAVIAPMDAFTTSRGDRHPTDLAMMRGARLITASETEEGRPWAEARIKQMTGGDPITARFMRQDFFTFTPHFKLTIIGNHQPVLHNVDAAARRRFCIVPFTIRPAVPDLQLEVKLRAEWPGILGWMIEGCRDWQANGLPRPDVVAAATDHYFTDQDVLGHWLAEECDLEPGNSHKWERSSDLFASWRAFASRSGEDAGSNKTFSARLERNGFPKRRTRDGSRFEGLNLIKPALSMTGDR